MDLILECRVAFKTGANSFPFSCLELKLNGREENEAFGRRKDDDSEMSVKLKGFR